MAIKKILKENGNNIVPVTRIDCVYNNGESLDSIIENFATINYVDNKFVDVNAVTLNGYSLWVGTTEELEKIENRDENTLYLEINDTNEEFIQVTEEEKEYWNNKVDLEDLPCYDNRVFETITSPVVFDGNLTDKTVVELSPAEYFVKVSDTAPVVNGELFSLEVTGFDTDGGESTRQIQNPNVDKNDSYINFNDYIIFVYSESTVTLFNYDEEYTLTPGIWFFKVQVDGYEFYVKNYNMTFLLEGELKELPSQFVDYITGKKFEGETCVVSIAQTGSDGYPEQVDNIERTAGEGSEIFNDYENNKATGDFSHSEGTETMAVETGAHAEGVGTKALGHAAHAEGNRTSALGNGSHSEGIRSIAIGGASHAEGYETEANGERGHTEGANTKTARGTYYGHAEGYKTEANGQYASHAEGYYTKASSSYQHVQGKYNIEDAANTYAHIVGNGTSEANRKNAHTLDWDGNAWFQGNVSVDGTPTNDNDLTTKLYVDNIVNPTLNIINVNDSVINLTTDKYQKVEITDGTEIVLPTVTDFTEIHLYFSTLADLTLIFPPGKYQKQPEINANRTYEFIFTYIGEWLIGYIEYGN